MVNITYMPIKEIAVHEVIKHSLSEFTKMKARPQNPNMPPSSVRWADGIVFSVGSYPLTTELTNEQVQGKIHWANVEFAEMPEYQQMLANQDSGGSILVTDYSNNTAVTDFVRWLKNQPQWFSASAGT